MVHERERSPRAGARRGASACGLLAIAFGALAALCAVPNEVAAQCVPLTFTVDSTSDVGDIAHGDGVCSSPQGVCTLRAAIQEANLAACEPTTIHFDIGGGGHRIILTDGALGLPLPKIVRSVVIDGTTQPGASANTAGVLEPGNANLLIELRGGGVVHGLATSCPTGGAQASVIRGLVFNGFASYGFLNESCDGVVFAGNYVGVTRDGTGLGPGAASFGVAVSDAASNQIGGPSPADRNVIAGASVFNVLVAGNADPLDPSFRTFANQIVNNFVGTNAAGTSGIAGAPIAGRGIFVGGRAATPVVPDPDPSTPQHELGNLVADNVVAGHLGHGLWTTGGAVGFGAPSASAAAWVVGNIVGHGTQAAAFLLSGGEGPLPAPEASLANGEAGIQVGDAANGWPSDDNLIERNAVTQSARGIDLRLGDDNRVLENLIWENQGPGLRFSSFGTLLANRIWDNGGLGIEAAVAAEPLPWIVLGGLVAGVVDGSVDVPTEPFPVFNCVETRIQFFASDTCDPSGRGEGRTLVDEVVLPGCPPFFAHELASAPPPGEPITAVASWVLTSDAGGITVALPPISTDFSNCVADVESVPSLPAWGLAGLAALLAGLGRTCRGFRRPPMLSGCASGSRRTTAASR